MARVPAADRPPYARLVERLQVRGEERTLRHGVTGCWTYGPDDAPCTLVFLHGLRGDHHGLEPIVAHLTGLRVVVPDLPGFGASPPLRYDRHDIAGYTSWLLALLAELGGEPVLVGHSFGSIVAAAAAARAAGIAGLVLVNPIATSALHGPRRGLTRLTVGYHRLAAALPESLGTALLRHPLLTRIASAAMATTPDPALRRWIHAEHGRYFAGFANRGVLLEAFHASIGHDVGEFAPDIAVPTMLVAAERDDIAPLRAQRALVGRFRDARLVVVPGVGHLAHYEAPAAVAAAIMEFACGS
ncbi:alpha/beta fold hydrolase [Mycobacterium sp. Aquia_216]|uniref:alpha/beta fold hydrolase n=1 Tax=Mycobacterium sp. Aquia_216 TaxID=2991729 RepID=UPI00227B27E5|nr:alpha/beta fold hydrolase [Mycobacterium sp. Aquia_216]WAJ47151.1 alpha/beta fold hydrolase [Mycobacterium sp. Aquia_216]